MGQRNNSRDGRFTFQRIGHLAKIQVEFSLEDMDMSGFQNGTTYEEIKAYMLEKYGLKVSSLYISQIKRERVDIYEQEQPDGRFLKHIKFRFPVYFNGKEIEEMSWDNETTVETVCETTVETVCLLTRIK